MIFVLLVIGGCSNPKNEINNESVVTDSLSGDLINQNDTSLVADENDNIIVSNENQSNDALKDETSVLIKRGKISLNKDEYYSIWFYPNEFVSLCNNSKRT